MGNITLTKFYFLSVTSEHSKVVIYSLFTYTHIHTFSALPGIYLNMHIRLIHTFWEKQNDWRTGVIVSGAL